MAKESRMLVSRYVSENLKKNAKRARACNVATWFVENYSDLAGDYVSSRDIRAQIPDEVKKPGLNPSGDLKAHGDAINKLGLSLEQRGKDRMVDMSLPNLKRCVSFLLGSRGAGALILHAPQSQEDLSLIDELDRVCGTNTVVFKGLGSGERAFVSNLTTNYRDKGWPLSDRQKAWALDLIDNNR